MEKIKVSEIFYSLQCEGQYICPSIFLRVFGCNFTCSGFGMPKGNISTERDEIANNIHLYKSYKDLPLVNSGCDSFPAWDVRFKHLSPMLSIKSIVDEFEKLLPDSKFNKNKHLILTGGEPLLGWQKSYINLFEEIYNRNMGLTHLTFETNGTQYLNTEFFNYLENCSINKNLEVTFSISAKLPCSGEPWEKAIKPDVIKQYISIYNNRSYFKFVVSTQEDVNDALKAIKEYNNNGIDIPVYLMPEGGTIMPYKLNEKQVADYCRDNGLRFSPRLQISLYKNAWGA